MLGSLPVPSARGAGRVSAAVPTSRLADPLHGRDIQDGHHAGPLPDLPSTRRAPNLWRYHEATNRKRALVRCPLAQRR